MEEDQYLWIKKYENLSFFRENDLTNSLKYAILAKKKIEAQLEMSNPRVSARNALRGGKVRLPKSVEAKDRSGRT